MKDRFVSIIMTCIILMIFLAFGFLAIILLNEFEEVETVGEIEENQEEIAEKNDEEILKENYIQVSTVKEKEKEEEIKTPKVIENPLDKIKPESSKQENTNSNKYDNINVDNYFYNQLEEYAKIIYRSFETNKENMKNGVYQIEFGNSFSDILKQSNGQQLLNNHYQSAIEAYIYDNPDIFYLNPNKMYLNIEKITRGSNVSYNAYINCGNQDSYLADGFNSKQQVEQAISNVSQIRNSILQNRTGSTYNDIKMVHDYIINNTEYDTTISRPNIYNIYGALVNKQAVCEGYAKTFKYMMDGLGIPCTLVIGVASNSEGKNENHAWNYVKLDGNWYAIDTTWDDPISTSGWVSESSKTKYWLKGSREILQDHSPSGQFSQGGKIFNYPTISMENYQ